MRNSPTGSLMEYRVHRCPPGAAPLPRRRHRPSSIICASWPNKAARIGNDWHRNLRYAGSRRLPVGSEDRAVLLHAFHTAGSGREWLLPIMLASGMGVALAARWLARRGRLPHDDDEP